MQVLNWITEWRITVRFLGRLMSWVYRMLFLRIVPLILIIGIGVSGYFVVDAVSRQFDERDAVESRQADFDETATAIVGDSLAVLIISTDVPTLTPTPLPIITLISTDVPTQVPTVTPTDTDTSPPVSPTIVPTDIPVDTATSAPTITETQETHDVSAQGQQVFITNTPFSTHTPRPMVFATNTPLGGINDVASATLIPTQIPATDIPLPTLTPNEVLPPTPTPIPPTPEIVATNPPLPTPFFPQNPGEGAVAGGTLVPTEAPLIPRNYDLVNILILGGDDGLTNDNFNRTDSMIIVSINRDTGTVGLLHLPRDLYVYLPTGQMQRLNVTYAIGENIGWTGGGFGLIRQTILYNFGINVHHYVRANFTEFQEIIDNFGGVEIANDCEYQGYALIGAEVPSAAIQVNDDALYQLPVGYYQMTGAEALWYARVRDNSDDFDRGRRQIQIIRALWRQIRNSGELSLTNLPNLWNDANSLVETDLNLQTMISLLPTALDLDLNTIQNYYLIRTYHTTPWQPPDGSFVQLPVYETLRPLLEDFYLPPPQSQLAVQGASIAIRNGSANDNWDLVAADRLGWEGFNAVAYGDADTRDYTDTVLIDNTGQTRGGSLNQIASLLNVAPENIMVQPDPNRTTDYEVIIGSNYDSCSGVVVDINTE